MANLSIRKLDNKTYEHLQRQAKKHGVSMEEEVRRILKQATSSPERLGDLFLQYFGSDNGVELELSEREPHQPVDL